MPQVAEVLELGLKSLFLTIITSNPVYKLIEFSSK
jgi:hypothetical protein